MELLELIEGGDDVVRITADQRASPAHRKKPVKDILDFLRPSEADRTCAPRRKGGPTRTEPARRPRRWPGRGPQALGRGASLRGPRTACARPSRRSLPGRGLAEAFEDRAHGPCSGEEGSTLMSTLLTTGACESAAFRRERPVLPSAIGRNAAISASTSNENGTACPSSPWRRSR